MIDLSSIFAVFRFETRQAATVPRMAWWLALALFPVGLTFLLQWADNELSSEGNAPPAEIIVRDLKVDAISKGGTPTITVDGKKLSGMAALSHISKQGESESQRRLRDITKVLVERAKENLPRNGDEPPANPMSNFQMEEPKAKPILIIQHPADIKEDDERLEKAEAILKDSFEAVYFYPEGGKRPNVKPPTAGSLFWGAGLYVLLPSVVAMLSTFLWAAPAIASELEGRSWAYIATRPHGPVSVLLGKYLIGVVWGMSAALTGLTLSLMIAKTGEGYFYLFKPLCILILLSCPAYGAIFTLIGTIAPRRSMVVSVAYILTLEGMISILPVLGIPSLISRITVQYPLRSMMVRALRLDEVPEDFNPLTRLAVSESNTLLDVGSILMITIATLTAAVFVLRSQELTQADESDS